MLMIEDNTDRTGEKSLREQVEKLEDDKKKLIVRLVDYEELKTENERLKKQLAKR